MVIIRDPKMYFNIYDILLGSEYFLKPVHTMVWLLIRRFHYKVNASNGVTVGGECSWCLWWVL